MSLSLADYIKFHDEVLDYGIEWKTLGLDADEIIVTSTWNIDPAVDLVKLSTRIQNDTCAVVWVSGGTADMTYTLVNTIVTSAGRTLQRYITVTVRLR